MLLWQFLTVHYNRSGNWSALFVTGSDLPVPPQLAAATYRFPGTGYDGEMYRYVAHAPFVPNGYQRYLDDPEQRYRRILVPALAYVLAAGQQPWIDAAYIAVIALFVFLGAYWLSRWAVLHAAHPAWALAFLAAPAALISMDRMTVDVAVAALTAGFILYSETEERPKLYALLLFACLVRETGLLLVAGACAFELFGFRWRRAALWASSALPMIAWYVWLHHRYPSPLRLGAPTWFLKRFGPGLFFRLVHPRVYPLPPSTAAIVRVSDSIALLGILLACVLAIVMFCRAGPKSPAALTALFCTILVFLLTNRTYWSDAISYARVMSPLLLLVSLPSIQAQSGRAWWLGLVPTALVDLRVGAQLFYSVSGVVRGLLHF